jgi:hypothetical protein
MTEMSHESTDAMVGASGRTTVVVEQSAQSLTTANLARVHCGRLAVDDLVVQSLMIAFAVLMLDELVHRCPEMPFPPRNHPIQTLLLNRSYEPLRVGVGLVGSSVAMNQRVPLRGLVHQGSDRSA